SVLIVDTSKNIELLGWRAPFSFDESLKLMFKK
ncbi:UDP-glucose 4-epimerase, partial [Acinetobacter baumannii]|nr:UDP-glucose 4-epimerase [Acinetobacter baumannii]